MLRSQTAFRRFAWSLLGYTLLVILWGGFVRASGSGAGCGDHWPLCNGDVIPRSPAVETMIEFSHRLTSGVAGVLSVVLVVWALMAFGRRSTVFRASLGVLFFMALEAAIGAGLVLFEYVAYNASIARAYWMATHLVNTFFLLAMIVLTAWTAGGGTMPRLRNQATHGWLVVASLIALLILGASGAVTALGDTLATGGSIDPSENPIVGTLVGLRLYHPILACAVFLVIVSTILAQNRHQIPKQATRFGRWLAILMVVQLIVGLANVQLHAPIWIQLVHLLLTDLIWISAILYWAASTRRNTKPSLVSGT
ncbi:MAG: COX15/CtaA family protein [Rubricoccaceae bacterium]|nr:COX15/CtaA family protein [Rubricoccaceae bacterium]